MTAVDNSVSPISLRSSSEKDFMKRKSRLSPSDCCVFATKRLKILCTSTVVPLKSTRKASKNIHNKELKTYAKHTTDTPNRKSPTIRTNNLQDLTEQRSVSLQNVKVYGTSIANTDMRQHSVENMSQNTVDSIDQKSTSPSHEFKSIQQHEAPKVFGKKLDSEIHIESSNDVDDCSSVKNTAGIFPTTTGLHALTKLQFESHSLAKDINTKDITLNSIDVNTECPESQESTFSIQKSVESNANNKNGSDVNFTENNMPKSRGVSRLQNLPGNINTVCTKDQNSNTNTDNRLRVQAISSKELATFLCRYNLTLKAVSRKIPNAEKIESDSLQTNLSSGKEDAATAVNGPKHANSNSNGQDQLATIGVSRVGDTVFRTTRQGTFSNWKIGGTRCAKHSPNTKASRIETKSESITSPYTKRLENGRRKKRKNTEEGQCSIHIEHSIIKLSDTSCFQSQIKMFPLSNAFHDLEARDKATEQTIENSKIQDNMWPLSPTMHNLLNDRNPTTITELQSDPMLTSAVAKDNNEDDFIAESDLELSRDSLSYPESVNKGDSDLINPNDQLTSGDVSIKNLNGDYDENVCPAIVMDSLNTLNSSDKISGENLKTETNLDQFPNEQHNSVSHGSANSDDINMTFLTKYENNGVSSNVVASNGKSDVTDIKTCRKTSTESALDSHCSTNERVSSSNHCTSETKCTKLENLKINEYSDNPTLDNIRKSVENWNSKLENFGSSTKLTSSERTPIVSQTKAYSESENLGKYTGINRTLRSLTLDKLRKQFGDDALAKHFYQKIQKLASDKRTEAKNRNMYKKAGHCAVVGSPYISGISAEQLEESVQFEDLLGFENISGAFGLSDIFDGSDQLLGQSYSTSQPLTCYSSGLPLLNPDTQVNQNNSNARMEEGNQYYDVPLRSPPPLLSFAENSYTTDPTQYGKCCRQELIATNYCNQILPLSPSLVSAPHARPVSPSTFYNFPPVAPTPSYCGTTTRSSDDFMPCTNMHTANAKKIRSQIVSCIRDPTMSDTDSGIHSPDSMPSKYVNTSTSAVNVDSRLFFNEQNNSNSYLCETSKARDGLLWIGENGNNVSLNFEDKIRNKIYSPTEEQPSKLLNDSNRESNHESWERCSTLSASSSSSVGETQTKLFNMDDCKTYITDGPLHSRHSRKCFLKEETELFNPTMNTIVSVSEDNAANMNATKSTQHMVQECSFGRPAVFTNGGLNTLYQSFASCNRNSSVIDNASQFQKHAESSALKTYNATIKSGIKRVHFSKAVSDRSRGQRQNSDDSDDTLIDSLDVKIRRSSTAGKSAHLWEFIRDTLLNPLYCPRLIKWENRESGIFRFVQSDVVAGMWGEKKNNPKMTYEKLSRAMRYYYNREILERVDGRRLVYKFGKNAYGWKLSEKAQENSIKKEGTLSEKLQQNGSGNSSSDSPQKAENSTDNTLQSPVKRRRFSIKVEAKTNIKKQSTGPVISQSASVGKKVDRGSIKLAGVKRKSPNDDDPLSDSSKTTGIVKNQQKTPRSSCIVYLARPTRLTDFTDNEGESNVFKAQIGKWSSDTTSSPPRQSKLPSAEVLLGKQYKIATVAI